VLEALRERLYEWMAATRDPLLEGPVDPAPSSELNRPDQRSPSDPTFRVEPVEV
jgi:hypothetical protein